jgi:hypothetical protein
MIGIPQLCSDEHVLASDGSGCELPLQCLTDLPLIPITFRTIEMAKSNL